jgi:hypothetical protein
VILRIAVSPILPRTPLAVAYWAVRGGPPVERDVASADPCRATAPGRLRIAHNVSDRIVPIPYECVPRGCIVCKAPSLIWQEVARYVGMDELMVDSWWIERTRHAFDVRQPTTAVRAGFGDINLRLTYHLLNFPRATHSECDLILCYRHTPDPIAHSWKQYLRKPRAHDRAA